ncbi:tripartite motif-containing protein 35 [Salmo trutta]|uniref:tripartite motif-containing protein 35 n=1 Tax=Salmo trutta TaxID=8032 RepID=UPI001130871C|nr:tripartite motif-containing protein 35-like [Salmo trutta]
MEALRLEAGGLGSLSGGSTPLKALLPGAEGFVLPPGDPELCREHGEKFTLFCVDDLEPVCSQCGLTETHEGHRVYPITEAVPDCKGELNSSLGKLLGKSRRFEKVTRIFEHASQHNQSHAQQTERQIKEEFEKLHQFLREEEEARLARLREEEEERNRVMKEKRERMGKEMELLAKTIREIEEEMKEDRDDIAFLQNYQKTIKRTWQSHGEPEEVCGPLIDVSKHLTNLLYTVWNDMLHIAPYTPVTLDPTTSCPSLVLSPGLTSVQLGKERIQIQPANPERFDPIDCTLGWEGFSAGTHCWTVEVGESSNWTVGVASQSVRRREEFEACPEEGLWTLSLRNGTYRAMTTPCTTLPLDWSRPFHRIKVFLDWEEGQVEFWDAMRDKLLFTFTQRFTETLYPYFQSSCSKCWLVVLPQRVCVEVELDPIPGDDDGDQIPHDGSSNEGEDTKTRSTDDSKLSETGSPVEAQISMTGLPKILTTDQNHETRSPDKTSNTGSAQMMGRIPKTKSTRKGKGKIPHTGSAVEKQITNTRSNGSYHITKDRPLVQVRRTGSTE